MASRRSRGQSHLSIAGIVIIVVTIVTGLEIRKISKEINEIDIEKNKRGLCNSAEELLKNYRKRLKKYKK